MPVENITVTALQNTGWKNTGIMENGCEVWERGCHACHYDRKKHRIAKMWRVKKTKS